MGTSTRFSCALPAFGMVVILSSSGVQPTRADQPTGVAPAAAAPAAGEPPVPQENFLSSLKQAFKQDFDHQVVRGHFEVGSPPDSVHRYYCLVDAKTGKRQANGVAGEPLPRADGMTGIRGTAVSLYSCASAEQEGLLVTTGYRLVGGAAKAAAAPAPVPPAASVPPAPLPPAAPSADAPAASVAAALAVPTSRVDIAGVKLGMSLEEVRAILRSKKLLDYHESTQTLGHLGPVHAGEPPAPGMRFVNVVAAWTPAADGDAESYQVMFTPVPGRERAMAIVHSVAYSPAHAVSEAVLAGGLVRKYGGYVTAEELPASPTWRLQRDGAVQVGDACKRRQLFGGLRDLAAVGDDRPNVALKTTPEEFRYQLDLCGVAIVTEDHVAASGTPPQGARSISRFTVTAYSPSIGFEGATAAAQVMQGGTALAPADKVNAAHTAEPAAPNL